MDRRWTDKQEIDKQEMDMNRRWIDGQEMDI